MRLTVIALVNSVLGTVLKVLEGEQEELETRGRIQTIQTTSLL